MQDLLDALDTKAAGEDVTIVIERNGEEKTLKGSFYGSARFHLDMPRILNLYRQGKLDLDGLVSRRYPLAEINEAFDALRNGEVSRSVLTIGAE